MTHWIIQLISKLTCFIPRPKFINPDEGGVRITGKWFFKGVRIKDLSAGLYWYIPLFQHCKNIKIKEQVKDLRCQSVWTKDGQELAISGTVRYQVNNVRKAILEVFDYDENLQNTALRTIFKFVIQRESKKLMGELVGLEQEILKDLREASRGWGLKIKDVGLTDIGKTMNIRLLTNEPIMSIRTEE